MNKSKKISIAVDFDGVLHSFRSGWQGPRKISDYPTWLAMLWLERMIADPRIDVSIYSARSWHIGGSRKIRKWLIKWGIDKKDVRKLKFWMRKPPVDLIIDDRCWCFKGVFPSAEELLEFKPWHGNPVWEKETDNANISK